MAITKFSFAGAGQSIPAESGDPERSQGLPDSKTKGLLNAIKTPTKSVKAGAKASGKGK